MSKFTERIFGANSNSRLTKTEKSYFNKENHEQIELMKVVDPELFSELMKNAESMSQTASDLYHYQKPIFRNADKTNEMIEHAKRERLRYMENIEGIINLFEAQIEFYKDFYDLARRIDFQEKSTEKADYLDSLKRWFDERKSIGSFDGMRVYYSKNNKEFNSDSFGAFMLKNGLTFNI